ncbi:hypothetical protein L596_023933 [Steinernema carpocapsae]|uniref:Uncharacterized protein n=1 Tax=Steinernema carpocapsae TaxID=34508 RepID=A0A4U5MF58_STECR|nr:hypothetical protein L596_023933 [Steinernema carpocapsae]
MAYMVPFVEYENLRTELRQLQEKLSQQSSTIISLNSVLKSVFSAHSVPPPPQIEVPLSTNFDPNAWRRVLLFTNNNANGEKNKKRAKISTRSAVEQLLQETCKLAPSAIRDFSQPVQNRMRVELDSENSVLQALRHIEEMRDEDGKLPFSTKVVREWPVEQKELRQKRFYEVAAKAEAGYYVNEIDLQVKKTNSEWRSQLYIGNTKYNEPIEVLTKRLCAIGGIQSSDVLDRVSEMRGYRLRLRLEEHVLRVLVRINEKRMMGTVFNWSVSRWWPEKQLKERLAMINDPRLKHGFYLDEIDLKVKPCVIQQPTADMQNVYGSTESIPREPVDFSFQPLPDFDKTRVVFRFDKSPQINVSNAPTKFAQVVQETGVSIASIQSAKSPDNNNRVLLVTFNDESSAIHVVKKFQEKRIRDALKNEFRNTRMCFQLPPELVRYRHEMYLGVNNKKTGQGIENLYVDELDLKIKEIPAEWRTSARPLPWSRSSSSMDSSEAFETQEEKLQELPSPRSSPSMDSTVSSSQIKRTFKIRYSMAYMKMDCEELIETLFGNDASEIKWERSISRNELEVTVKPESQKSFEEILDRTFPDGVEIKW